MKKNGKYGKRRGNHCGTIVKKGNSWMARWWVAVESEFLKDANGTVLLNKDGTPKHPQKRISLMTGASTLEEAREFLEKKTHEFGLDKPHGLLERLLQLKASMEEKRHQEELKKAELEKAKPGLLLSQGFDAYAQSTKRPDSGNRTLSDYKSHYTIFAGWMEDHHPDIHEVRHVTTAVAEEYAKHIRKTLSSESHNKKIKFLKRCWKTLASIPDSKVMSNPWDGIRNLTSDSIAHREFSVEELGKIAKVLPPDYKLLFAIGIYTGLRLKDCALLDWGEIDLIQGKIQTTPRKTKRKYNRLVILPIHPTLRMILSYTPEDKRTGPVIPALAAKYALKSKGSTISRKFESYLEAVGIKTSIKPEKGQLARPQATFHSLRHTFTSIILNNGGSYQMVQKMLGHASLSMTDRYTHETITALFNTVRKIPDIPALLESEAAKGDVIDVTAASALLEAEAKTNEVERQLDGLSNDQLEIILKAVKERLKNPSQQLLGVA